MHGLSGLVAIGTVGVEWQIADLHGDVVAATAGVGLDTISKTNEFGELDDSSQVGNVKYGWLGGAQRAGDNPGGVVLMGVRLYNPAMGRFLSVDPVLGGSANRYDYVDQDPVNKFDLDGRCFFGCSHSHNYNGHHWHWWGLELDLSRSRATTLALYLGAGASIATIAAAVAGVIPGGQMASALLWVLDGACGWFAFRIGLELHQHSKDGVTVNFSFGWVSIGHE